LIRGSYRINKAVDKNQYFNPIFEAWCWFYEYEDESSESRQAVELRRRKRSGLAAWSRLAAGHKTRSVFETHRVLNIINNPKNWDDDKFYKI